MVSLEKEGLKTRVLEKPHAVLFLLACLQLHFPVGKFPLFPCPELNSTPFETCFEVVVGFFWNDRFEEL